jgi:hypothetical protein
MSRKNRKPSPASESMSSWEHGEHAFDFRVGVASSRHDEGSEAPGPPMSLESPSSLGSPSSPISTLSPITSVLCALPSPDPKDHLVFPPSPLEIGLDPTETTRKRHGRFYLPDGNIVFLVSRRSKFRYPSLTCMLTAKYSGRGDTIQSPPLLFPSAFRGFCFTVPSHRIRQGRNQ